jgi:uncharacterized membrane protein (UPF0127 family)
MKVIEAESNTVLLENLEIANNPGARFLGLMGRKKLANNTGLLLSPCNSIHMFFMKFALDVVFLNKDGKVLKVIRNLKPWRISPVVFGSKMVIEMPSGTIPENLSLEDKTLSLVE